MNKLITRREYINNMSDLMHYDSFAAFVEHPCAATWDHFECEFDRGNDDYRIIRGATKGVVIPYDCDYVLKFPFLFEERYDYPSRVIYEQAQLDYCRCEWRNYLMAQKEGIAKCFAAMEYIDRVFETPVYAQEKCECDECEVSDEMYRTSYENFLDEMGYQDDDDARDEFCFDDSDDDAYTSLVYEKWDYKTANAFIDFCNDNRIDDLHSGNWSLVNDTLKAVDYSGYCISNLPDGWFDICEVA